jgi:Ser/Thr protein kinase RdoA (MazF antagonist)
MSVSDEVLREHLRDYRTAERIAVGMQGAVYRVGAGKVAKVWFHAGTAELRQLAEFYAQVHLAIRTPEILELQEGPRYRVTVEVELPGVPLYTVDPSLEAAQGCVLDVLGELAAAAVAPRLPVLDETAPFRAPGQGWPEALAGLTRRRVERFRGKLGPAIDDLDAKVERLLQRVPDSPTGLVHGDVTAGNILVDADCRPTAVIDFGLMTMAGDPAYDAASAGTMYALWSPEIRAIEKAFDAAVVSRFGYDPELLRTYRAIHLLLIANAESLRVALRRARAVARRREVRRG